MIDTQKAIDAARAGRVRQTELADRLEIDRTTLWKYERKPESAPEGFWERYTAMVDTLTAETREAAQTELEAAKLPAAAPELVAA